MRSQKELRLIVAGSSRFHAFLELLESKIADVSNLDIPIKPVDSLEIRQAIKSTLAQEVDILRHIPQDKNTSQVSLRRDDT